MFSKDIKYFDFIILIQLMTVVLVVYLLQTNVFKFIKFLALRIDDD
jgi:hypothetical protein